MSSCSRRWRSRTSAHNRIQELNLDLERRVQVRTTELETANRELTQALADVKQLAKLLPISITVSESIVFLRAFSTSEFLQKRPPARGATFRESNLKFRTVFSRWTLKNTISKPLIENSRFQVS